MRSKAELEVRATTVNRLEGLTGIIDDGWYSLTTDNLIDLLALLKKWEKLAR